MGWHIASDTRSTRIAVIAIALAVAASNLTAQQADTTRVASGDTMRPPPQPSERAVGTLRPGDELVIGVWKEKEFSGKYLIDSRGVVQIPGLGDIVVAGLTPVQAKDRLRQQLMAVGIDNPQVSVQPLIRVSVLGEVRSPNLYPVEPGTNLLQLITVAGGPSERANMRRVRVIRNGRPYVVDLQSALDGSPSGQVTLFSNDVVVVDRRRGLTRENISFGLSLATAALSLLSVLVVVGNR